MGINPPGVIVFDRLACPRCVRPLERRRSAAGMFFACPDCEGRLVMLPVVRRERSSRPFLRALWGRALAGDPGSLGCPTCRAHMVAVTVPAEPGALALDVCIRCHGVWFDAGEEAPPATPERKTPISPEDRQKLAIAQVEWMATLQREEQGDAPDEPWKTIPALFGMPVECEARTLDRWPVATIAVTAVAVLVSVLFGRSAIDSYGFVPEAWSRYAGLTLLTSFFIHAGPFHLVGNLYFLLVFGDDVEDHLGSGRFLILLLGSHLAGIALHGIFDPNPGIPCVGASAGIFGVMAFYAVTFPGAKIAFFWFLPWRWNARGAGWVRMPAWAMLGLFIVTQALGSIAQIEGFSSTSALAHVGGILVGTTAALVPKMRILREYSRPYEP